MASFGPDAFIGKLDIKHTFRLCPVHSFNWKLLCFYWKEHFYVDTRLQFCCISSLFIFNQFAESLVWILVHVFGLVGVVHYLDDLFVCAESYDKFNENMSVIQSTFDELKVPLQIRSLLRTHQ